MLLGTDGLEDEMDSEEYQLQLAQLKDKYEKKLEKEREQFRKSKEFLMHQVSLKDKRIDTLFDYVEDLKQQYKDLHQQYVDVVKQLLEMKKED